ncbi:MAG: peptidoglycan-associated lipoprotein Pal [Desulfuromonadaceae bacterium]|nr:peptidoglycan-associated lipoprotein Pal [Desulfuromonadaceae bacterium]MDD2846818.1 peptidoglycan-associated lipoprotein Pal [Desulfuromonadaceae bacterium]MDD4129204.1 peptidoglycan-associated lipoprotein Pal [Desulfuromonadaceae bacterium]
MNVYRKFIVVIGCLGVISGTVGCANKDIVKKDEPIVGDKAVTSPSVVSPPATDAKPLPDVKKDEEKIKDTAAVVSKTQQPVNTAATKADLEKVFFGFNSTELNQDARNTLALNAEILMKIKQDVKMKIEGHCDERGSAEYNLALGERRAKAAAKYLMAMGVQAERLSTISYGEEHPAVQGHDESAWSKNRRDEFVIQK